MEDKHTSNRVFILSKRLEELSESKYLSRRIFQRVSENMHYEIFKFLTPIQLLDVALLNSGGFQLISNRILRARIKIYFTILKPIIPEHSTEEKNIYRIKQIFSHNGKFSLIIDKDKVKNEQLHKLFCNFDRLSELREINCGNFNV